MGLKDCSLNTKDFTKIKIKVNNNYEQKFELVSTKKGLTRLFFEEVDNIF